MRIVIEIANFEINRRHTSLIWKQKQILVSEQVGVLLFFLVEMCEPDGSEACNTFFNGAIWVTLIAESAPMQHTNC